MRMVVLTGNEINEGRYMTFTQNCHLHKCCKRNVGYEPFKVLCWVFLRGCFVTSLGFGIWTYIQVVLSFKGEKSRQEGYTGLKDILLSYFCAKTLKSSYYSREY